MMILCRLNFLINFVYYFCFSLYFQVYRFRVRLQPECCGPSTNQLSKLIDNVEYVFQQHDNSHKQKFESSYLKNLLKLRAIDVGYQLFHQLLLRGVQTQKPNEVWFNFKGKFARFGLEEFILITGLNVGVTGEEIVDEKAPSYLVETYFPANKRKGKIDRLDLKKAFCMCNSPEEKYRLGLVVCVVWVLLGAEENTFLSPWLLSIAGDVDKFNNYPWGKKSFLQTMKNFNRKLESGSAKSV